MLRGVTIGCGFFGNKYSNNKEIKELYFFIYDPNSFILNREEFILDLEKDKSRQFEKIKIIIKPEL